MDKHLNIKISGRVQGVFFRNFAKEKAEQLRITGFAQNEPDGSLYLEIEGGEDNLEKFVEWCGDGPDLARIEKVEITEGTLKNFQEFFTQ